MNEPIAMTYGTLRVESARSDRDHVYTRILLQSEDGDTRFRRGE